MPKEFLVYVKLIFEILIIVYLFLLECFVNCQFLQTQHFLKQQQQQQQQD